MCVVYQNTIPIFLMFERNTKKDKNVAAKKGVTAPKSSDSDEVHFCLKKQ